MKEKRERKRTKGNAAEKIKQEESKAISVKQKADGGWRLDPVKQGKVGPVRENIWTQARAKGKRGFLFCPKCRAIRYVSENFILETCLYCGDSEISVAEILALVEP